MTFAVSGCCFGFAPVARLVMFHSQYLPLAAICRLQFEPIMVQSWLERAVQSTFTLVLCKLTIFFVSAVDTYLTIKYVDFLPTLELNPVGRWLMNLDPTAPCELKQIAFFITAKFAGNYIALFVIDFLAAWKRRVAIAVAMGVAFCQLVLFYFLTYYESHHI